MRRAAVCLVIALTISGDRLNSASEQPARQLSVTIQIHDYANVEDRLLSQATSVVSGIYERVGVRTEWIGVVRQGRRRASADGERSRLPIGQLTLIILTPKMAARTKVADGVLGFAAVAPEGMGRIAYVIHDRVRRTAREAAMEESTLLGFVMAHEMGHLLLPHESPAGSGLMRGLWDVRDFRNVDVSKLGFSERQAAEIRSTIENASPTTSADAGGHQSTDGDIQLSIGP
jgi:hypothetical protein